MTTLVPALTRRRALGLSAGAAALLALPRAGRAQDGSLTVLGHRVHESAATSGPGGDATAAWRAASGTEITWATLGDVSAIHERLLREASLAETSIDLAHLLNGRATPSSLSLFEPLDALMAQEPIEDFADIAPGLLEPMRLEGTIRGIPVRHATNTLIYNEALFEERGVPLPRTFEDLVEAARRLTYRRPDGTRVYGLVFTPVFASNFLTFARALGADYMTPEGRIVASEAPMVRALSILAGLYKDGVLPRNMAVLNNEEVTTWMQQGRAAMTANPFARLVTYNDPQASRYPGRLKPMMTPMAADLVGKLAFASTTGVWSMVIPRNARRKQAAWGLIRALSSKAGTLAMALNGNGPVRLSTYAEPRLRESLPYAALEADAVAAARVDLPAFDEQSRAHDIFVEESLAAVLGMKPAETAMKDAIRRVQPLVRM